MGRGGMEVEGGEEVNGDGSYTPCSFGLRARARRRWREAGERMGVGDAPLLVRTRGRGHEAEGGGGANGGGRYTPGSFRLGRARDGVGGSERGVGITSWCVWTRMCARWRRGSEWRRELHPGRVRTSGGRKMEVEGVGGANGGVTPLVRTRGRRWWELHPALVRTRVGREMEVEGGGERMDTPCSFGHRAGARRRWRWRGRGGWHLNWNLPELSHPIFNDFRHKLDSPRRLPEVFSVSDVAAGAQMRRAFGAKFTERQVDKGLCLCNISTLALPQSLAPAPVPHSIASSIHPRPPSSAPYISYHTYLLLDPCTPANILPNNGSVLDLTRPSLTLSASSHATHAKSSLDLRYPPPPSPSASTPTGTPTSISNGHGHAHPYGGGGAGSSLAQGGNVYSAGSVARGPPCRLAPRVVQVRGRPAARGARPARRLLQRTGWALTRWDGVQRECGCRGIAAHADTSPGGVGMRERDRDRERERERLDIRVNTQLGLAAPVGAGAGAGLSFVDKVAAYRGRADSLGTPSMTSAPVPTPTSGSSAGHQQYAATGTSSTTNGANYSTTPTTRIRRGWGHEREPGVDAAQCEGGGGMAWPVIPNGGGSGGEGSAREGGNGRDRERDGGGSPVSISISAPVLVDGGWHGFGGASGGLNGLALVERDTYTRARAASRRSCRAGWRGWAAGLRAPGGKGSAGELEADGKEGKEKRRLGVSFPYFGGAAAQTKALPATPSGLEGGASLQHTPAARPRGIGLRFRRGCGRQTRVPDRAFKMEVRGTKLVLHKQPGDRAAGVRKLFAVGVVEDAEGGVEEGGAGGGGQRREPASMGHKKRAYWGRGRHPALGLAAAGAFALGGVLSSDGPVEKGSVEAPGCRSAHMVGLLDALGVREMISLPSPMSFPRSPQQSRGGLSSRMPWAALEAEGLSRNVLLALDPYVALRRAFVASEPPLRVRVMVGTLNWLVDILAPAHARGKWFNPDTNDG
ncbi:hypothetical protein B0H11DRAFT_1932758 [Mycena galericulata]|nr:hypothetical protein B0H11DRAFT_1932758 [Mycena galericulata]